MKSKLLTFFLGAACGALGLFLTYLTYRPATPASADAAEVPKLTSIRPDRRDQKIAELEGQLAELTETAMPGSSGEPVASGGEESPGGKAKASFQVLGGNDGKLEFDLGKLGEQMQQQQKDRDDKRIAAKLASLVRSLNLTPDQEGAVRDLLEKQAASKRSGLASIMKFAAGQVTDGDSVGLVSAVVGEDGGTEDAPDFDAELRALLDGEQSAAYDELLAARAENYIEASASRQIAQLQTSIPDLTVGQKDAAFIEFARLAREDAEAHGAPDQDAPFGFDPQRMMRQREAETAAMRAILSPDQFEVYQSSAGRSIVFGGGPGAIISSQVIIDNSSVPATEVEIPAAE